MNNIYIYNKTDCLYLYNPPKRGKLMGGPWVLCRGRSWTPAQHDHHGHASKGCEIKFLTTSWTSIELLGLSDFVVGFYLSKPVLYPIPGRHPQQLGFVQPSKTRARCWMGSPCPRPNSNRQMRSSVARPGDGSPLDRHGGIGETNGFLYTFW